MRQNHQLHLGIGDKTLDIYKSIFFPVSFSKSSRIFETVSKLINYQINCMFLNPSIDKKKKKITTNIKWKNIKL